tara:strand:- start:3703 stop:3876 length:174 start_codon:yes stop_codon:yes gene_type:complete
MAEQIKVGDTVRLKSGGPLMTVEHIDETEGIASVLCSWFVEDEKKTSLFPPETLGIE